MTLPGAATYVYVSNAPEGDPAAFHDEAGPDEEWQRQQDEVNRTFHRTLLEHSGSSRLRAMLDTMIDMPIIVRSFYLYTKAELEQSLHHHQDLTLAAEAHDGELARQVMQLHLRMSYHRFMRHRGEYRPKG